MTDIKAVSGNHDFEVKASANSINVIGVIDAWDENDFLSIKEKIDARVLDNAAAVVHFNVTSHGGNAFDGLAAFSYLRALPNPVHVDVFGYAGSAATLLVAAADVASIGESDAFLVHRARVCGCGGDVELSDLAAQVSVVDDSMVRAYMRKSGRSEEAVRDLMDRDRYISAQEALEFGLVDRIRGECAVSALARAASDFDSGDAVFGGVALDDVVNSGVGDVMAGDVGVLGESVDVAVDASVSGLAVGSLDGALGAPLDDLAVALAAVDRLEAEASDLRAALALAESVVDSVGVAAEAVDLAVVSDAVRGALRGALREELAVELRDELRAEFVAEQAAVVAARTEVSVAGFEVSGESVVDIYRHALGQAKAPVEGLDVDGLKAVFAAVRGFKVGISNVDLMGGFLASGDSVGGRSLSREERAARFLDN